MNRLTPSQKQIVALLVIVPIGLIQALILLVALSTIFENEEVVWMDLVSFLFVLALLTFPIIWAIRLWKRGKREKEYSDVIVSPNTSIRFTTQVTVENYRKLLMTITFTHPVIIFIYVLSAGMLGVLLSTPDNEAFHWWSVFVIAFAAYLPFSVYRRANSNYRATKSLHEETIYEFTTSQVTITGESYNTTMQWQTFHKVREMKGWFLLYCNNQTACLIPKSVFATPADMNSFRNLVFGSIRLKD